MLCVRGVSLSKRRRRRRHDERRGGFWERRLSRATPTREYSLLEPVLDTEVYDLEIEGEALCRPAPPEPGQSAGICSRLMVISRLLVTSTHLELTLRMYGDPATLASLPLFTQPPNGRLRFGFQRELFFRMTVPDLAVCTLCGDGKRGTLEGVGTLRTFIALWERSEDSRRAMDLFAHLLVLRKLPRFLTGADALTS